MGKRERGSNINFALKLRLLGSISSGEQGKETKMLLTSPVYFEMVEDLPVPVVPTTKIHSSLFITFSSLLSLFSNLTPSLISFDLNIVSSMFLILFSFDLDRFSSMFLTRFSLEASFSSACSINLKIYQFHLQKLSY